MARSRADSLIDLDQMDESIDSLASAMFAKKYFERRFSEARDRVLEDLGDVGKTLYALVDKEDLVSVARHLREQFND